MQHRMTIFNRAGHARQVWVLDSQILPDVPSLPHLAESPAFQWPVRLPPACRECILNSSPVSSRIFRILQNVTFFHNYYP